MVVLEPEHSQAVEPSITVALEVSQPITSPLSKVVVNGYLGPAVMVFGPSLLVARKRLAAAVSGQGRPLGSGKCEVGNVRVEPL